MLPSSVMGWDNPLIHGPSVDIWIPVVAELELAALSLHILFGVIVQVGPVLSVPSDQILCLKEGRYRETIWSH